MEAYMYLQKHVEGPEKDLTREKFIKAVESISYQNFDLPHYKGATDSHLARTDIGQPLQLE